MNANRRSFDTCRTILPQANGERKSVELMVCSVPDCVACPARSYCRAFNQLRRAEVIGRNTRAQRYLDKKASDHGDSVSGVLVGALLLLLSLAIAVAALHVSQ